MSTKNTTEEKRELKPLDHPLYYWVKNGTRTIYVRFRNRGDRVAWATIKETSYHDCSHEIDAWTPLFLWKVIPPCHYVYDPGDMQGQVETLEEAKVAANKLINHFIENEIDEEYIQEQTALFGVRNAEQIIMKSWL